MKGDKSVQQNYREQVVFQQINTIRQLTSRLRQSEQRNSQLLDQLSQAETFATQELGRLDQLINQLEGQISQISQMGQRTETYGNVPFNYGQSTYSTPVNPNYPSGQYGNPYSPQYGGGTSQQEQGNKQ